MATLGLDLLREIPIWVWAPVVFALLKIAYRIGLRQGRLERERVGPEKAVAGGQVTLGAMLALLGLLMAFTYSFALNRADARNNALVAEVNAIGTAYQWADLAPEPGRTELQRRLLDYARTRALTADIANESATLHQAVARSLDALEKLWPAAKEAIGEPPHGPVQASTAAAIIAVGDSSTIRIAAGAYRIPHIVMAMLLLVMCLALMLVAYRAAKHDAVSALRSNAFALVLTALTIVIMDFDRPHAGIILLNQDGLLALIADIEANLAAR